MLQRAIEGEDGPLTVRGLRACDGKPNCFSTTGDEELEERVKKGVDTLISPWRAPADDSAPIRSLAKAVRGYQPGQGSIDGGGFRIVTETDTYLYVQFESLKKGFIDDVEFATTGADSKDVLVRSASRIGYTDFGQSPQLTLSHHFFDSACHPPTRVVCRCQRPPVKLHRSGASAAGMGN